MEDKKMKEVDSLAMADFWEEQNQMSKMAEKPRIQSCADFFKTAIPVSQEKLAVVPDKPMGELNTQTSKESSENSGITSWIKNHPVQSFLIGAAIAEGIYALCKHLNKDEEVETDKPKKKRKPQKRKKTLTELWEEKGIENDSPQDESEEDIHNSEEELNDTAES